VLFNHFRPWATVLRGRRKKDGLEGETGKEEMSNTPTLPSARMEEQPSAFDVNEGLASAPEDVVLVEDITFSVART
jgi:hypothetical protein